MLQIITGKFYNSEDRFHNDCKGILYSNVSFKGVYDIVISFALDAVFDEDKSTVERICIKKESGRGRYPVPSEFINGTFDISKNVTDDEMKSCGAFFEQLMALNREDYNNILNCIVAYNASIRLLGEDISLAYSMLVYCLESLAQSYDSYTPVWDDYKEDKKNVFEKVFRTIDEETVEKIKVILIKDEHLKLSKRFQELISDCMEKDSTFDISLIWQIINKRFDKRI